MPSIISMQNAFVASGSFLAAALLLAAVASAEEASAPTVDAVAEARAALPDLGADAGEFQETAARTRHRTGPSGARVAATNRRADTSLKLRFDSEGAIDVTDSGERSESVLAETYRRQEITAWATHWRGTWTAVDDQTRVATLELVSHVCVQSETWEPGETTHTACEPPPTALELNCVWYDDDDEVWRCARPDQSSVEGLGTSLPWRVRPGDCITRVRPPRGRPELRACGE